MRIAATDWQIDQLVYELNGLKDKESRIVEGGFNMRLPNAENAVVDIAKLRDYCLSMEHPRGRHKARVFAATLGLTADDSDELQSALVQAALTEEATASDLDEYGQRFAIDFIMTRPSGSARVRSTWIIRADEDFPRLTSCYVL